MQSFEPIAIQLQLSLVAYNLILKEFPLSEKYLKKVDDNNVKLMYFQNYPQRSSKSH